MGDIKNSGVQRAFALAISFYAASSLGAPFSFHFTSSSQGPFLTSASALAAESKWSIENTLDANDIEVDATNEVVDAIGSASVDRELAEMYFNTGDSKQAIKSAQTAIGIWKKNLTPYDVRIQSAKLLTSEAYLKAENRNACLKPLRAVLLQQLAADELKERKIRKKMSGADFQEKGVETSAQFEERYKKLTKNAEAKPAAEAIRRARLLFWENRLADSLRLTRIGLTLGLGTVDGADAHFLQALIYFAQGNRAEVIDAQRRLIEGQSVGSEKNPTYIKESENLVLTSKVLEARQKFLNGLVAELDGQHAKALEFYATAIETVKAEDERFDALLFRMYQGNALMASGNPVSAYQELNRVFETARRLVEGREQGLLYQGLSQVALMEMYQTLLVRMTYESEQDERGLVENRRLFDESRLGGDSDAFEVATETSSRRVATAKPFKEDYPALADALYHVGYQFKTSQRQALAQRCFWDSVYIIEKYVPEYKRQLGGTLYDLAESYFWSESYDVSIAVFQKCVDVRKKMDPNSLDYILTLNTLGRVYLAKGDSLDAINCFKSALHRLLHHEQLQATRISRMVADLRTSSGRQSDESPAPSVVASGDRYFELINDLPLPEQLNSVAKNRAGSDPDRYPQIDDLWQVLADSYSRHKSYDEAVEVSRRLLEERQNSKSSSQSEILGSLWQLAYICGVSNRHALADRYYSEMLANFGDNNPRWRAVWLYSRGVVLDSMGLPKRAASDFQKSIVEYKKYLKTLDKIDDKDAIDQTGWMISDLQQELKAKRRCPPSSSDYLKGYETSFWNKNRFPLKVYIDDSEARGFGPKLFALVKKAVDDWASTPGMEDKIKFVDDREKADIYLERVSNYDQIPFGSGGGASASFVWRGKKLTKEIERVHLRMYCADYDSDKMANHALLQLYTLALHEFGHGLGLGHSPSGLDVMYWKSAIDRLSSRDRASVRGIYGFQEERRGR